MTPVTITLSPSWAILDGPSVDGLIDALKGGTVEFVLLPPDAENLRRKLKLRARVRQVGNLGVNKSDVGRVWRAKVEFLSSPRFKVSNTSAVEVYYYTSGYGDRLRGRGGSVFDTTPDEERLWVAQGDGSIVRGLHVTHQTIIGNIRDLPNVGNK